MVSNTTRTLGPVSRARHLGRITLLSACAASWAAGCADDGGSQHDGAAADAQTTDASRDTGASDGKPSYDAAADAVVPIDPRFEQTEAAIEIGMAALRTALATKTVSAAFEQAATAIRAHEEVSSADVTTDADGNVTFLVEFTNGMLFTTPIRYVQSAPVPPQRSTGAGTTRAKMGLPHGRQALFMDLHGFTTDIAKYRKMAQDAGYTAVHSKSGKVADFKNLNSNALLYISSHGIHFKRKGTEYFVIQTEDQRNTIDDLAYANSGDFQDVSIVLSRGVYIIEQENPLILDDTTYAVSNVFFRKNTGAFPDDNLVYIDTCDSSKRSSDRVAPPLFGTLTGLNVKSYLGWSRSVANPSARRVSNYLFGHLLGDIPAGLAENPPKNPPIRPYGLTDVLTSLEQSKGWHRDVQGGKGAVFEIMDMNLGQRDILLVPSISQVSVDVNLDQQTQTLEVLGDFGDRPGQLNICELGTLGLPTSCRALTISSWEDNKITSELGSSCDACDGVVVVTVDHRMSNPHPLTEWPLDFTITGTFPSGVGPTVKVVAKAKFRAEIVDERPMPEMQPVKESAWAAPSFGLSSVCEYEFSGTFTGSDGCTYEYRKEENQGSVKASISGTEACTGTAAFKPVEQKATYMLAFSKVAVAHKTCPDVPETTEELQVVLATGPFDSTMGRYGTIGSVASSAGGYLVQYGPVTPETPPDARTPR